MLDADGICRWVTAATPPTPHKQKHWEKSQQAAARCIGAQYVASIDSSAKGGLVELPRVGIPMLFARADPQTGRISLVRTGTLVRFETRAHQQPSRDGSWDSGLREAPRERDSFLDEEDVRATREEIYPPTLETDDDFEDFLRSERYDPREWEPDPRQAPTREPALATQRPGPSTSDLYPTQSVHASSPPESSWTENTETSRFEPAPSMLEQMRPTRHGERPATPTLTKHPTLSTGLRPGNNTAPPQGLRPTSRTAPPPGFATSRPPPAQSMPVPRAVHPFAVTRPAMPPAAGLRPPTARLPPPPALPRVPLPRPPPDRAYAVPPPAATEPRRPRVVTPLPAPPGYRPLMPPPAPPRRYYSSGNLGGYESASPSWHDDRSMAEAPARNVPLRRAR
jgi:hypothetical protein